MSRGPRSLRSAIDATLAEYLADGSVPGIAVAVTDATGTIAAATAGWRDLAARRPVDDSTLFEIGSIGKSFAAVVILQLVDEGRVALNDPVVRHLPWFRVPRTGDRITIHHLLSHTAGITAGIEGTPEAVAQVWRLRDLRPGSAPGRHFHYSNLGYKAIGLVIEAVEGRPFAEVVRRRLLDPVGMADAEPAITNAVRHRLAIGYGPARDDVPFVPGDPLAPSTWLETASADGSIAATAPDLATWARWLMAGDHGYADRMIRVVTARDADGYGYGLAERTVDGRTYRGHTGGMVGFLAGMSWDVDAGIGAVALQNGPGRAPNALTRLLVRQARAVAEGRDPSAERPDAGSWEAFLAGVGAEDTAATPAPRTPPTDAQAVVTGTYRSHDPWTPVFRVEARGTSLFLAFPEHPDGAEASQLLVPMADSWYRLGADRLGPERVRFDLVIDGRARRAWLSGWPYYRVADD